MTMKVALLLASVGLHHAHGFRHNIEQALFTVENSDIVDESSTASMQHAQANHSGEDTSSSGSEACPEVQVSKYPDGWRGTQGSTYKYGRPADWASLYSKCGKLLGAGGYGYVLAVERKDGEGEVAVKYQEDGPTAQNELQMFERFSGVPEIVQHVADGTYVEESLGLAYFPTMHNYPIKTSYVAIAMEKADKTLAECQSEHSSSPQAKLRFFGAVLRGLKAMHDQHVAHRDVKLDNTLVFGDCETGVAKIADLGNACVTKNQKVSCHFLKGTILYMAPEMLDYKLWTTASRANDMWSAGLIFHQLVYGQLPPQLEEVNRTKNRRIQAKLKEAALKKAIKAMPEFDRDALPLPAEWSSLKDVEALFLFLSGLLQPKVSGRFDVDEALKRLKAVAS